MAEAVLQLFRDGKDGGGLHEYRVPVEPGMVALDAVL